MKIHCDKCFTIWEDGTVEKCPKCSFSSKYITQDFFKKHHRSQELEGDKFLNNESKRVKIYKNMLVYKCSGNIL